MIPVNFGKMLTACNDPLRGASPPAAFVHRTTGDVLFVKPGDEAAAKWFPGVRLAGLHAAVAASADWPAAPKHNGPVID